MQKFKICCVIPKICGKLKPSPSIAGIKGKCKLFSATKRIRGETISVSSKMWEKSKLSSAVPCMQAQK